MKNLWKFLKIYCKNRSKNVKNGPKNDQKMAFFGPFLAFLGPFEMAPMVARHIPKDPKNTLSAKMAVFWGFAKTGNPIFTKKGKKWPLDPKIMQKVLQKVTELFLGTFKNS